MYPRLILVLAIVCCTLSLKAQVTLPVKTEAAMQPDYDTLTTQPERERQIDTLPNSLSQTGHGSAQTIIENFRAVENQNTIQLTWNLNADTSFAHYELERSSNGVDFSTIAPQDYLIADITNGAFIFKDQLDQFSDVIYYRIKMLRHDGSYQYSKVLNIKLNPNAPDIIIYPNPARENIYLNISSREKSLITVSAWNATGAQVISRQFHLATGKNIITLSGVDLWPSGIYQIQIKWPNGKVFTQPVLKQ